MSTFPRLYEPSVRRFAWPVAMLMLLGWVGLLALGKPVPIWLEGLAAANLYLTANCLAASDSSGEVLLRAMALAAQLLFAVLIALWFTYTIVAEVELMLHTMVLLWMVLGFSAFSEAAYAYMRKDELGLRWLVGLLPGVLVVGLMVLLY